MNWTVCDQIDILLLREYWGDKHCTARQLSTLELASNPSARYSAQRAHERIDAIEGTDVVVTTGDAGETAVALAARGSGA